MVVIGRPSYTTHALAHTRHNSHTLHKLKLVYAEQVRGIIWLMLARSRCVVVPWEYRLPVPIRYNHCRLFAVGGSSGALAAWNRTKALRPAA